jgi:predicted transcriptional regulator
MTFDKHEYNGPERTGSLSVGQRRSNVEIIAEILRIGLHGAGKTEIMYTANMSYAQIQRYLDYLLGHGFITRRNKTGVMTSYHVTGEGARLLKTIESLMEMLGTQLPGK